MEITKVKTFSNGWVKRHYITINNEDDVFQIEYDWDKESFNLNDSVVDMEWLKSTLIRLAKLYIPVATLEILDRYKSNINDKSFEELMRYNFNIHTNDGWNYCWGYGENMSVLISIKEFIKGCSDEKD